ncbi:carbon-nitrogen hydrolase family protein [Bacillus xiapuensis]|uniref:Carbon-nitrogen hydrolase family protein n=1 Tax=Bacillus xiapuensis TaxID=2014075 RepID=A0ABU6N436_9BACI|nr:carbon-nitrogen hydrolase family protein [Bacillus xiapuensis]
MKVAVAQLKSSMDKSENLQKAKEYIKKAADLGADFVVLPEMYMAFTPAKSGVRPSDIAEPLDGIFVTGLAEAARGNQVYVICGIYESKPGETARCYNTTVFLNRSGELLQAYHKTHLYDAFNYKESDSIIPGSEAQDVIETEFGKVGMMVCYEIRFPEISRQLALKGADFFFIPAGWVAGPMKEDHWKTLLRARAIENTVYIFAADQVENIFSGQSMMVDPMGVVLASAGEEESLIISEIDPDRIKRVREKLPSVADRRPEFYTMV